MTAIVFAGALIYLMPTFMKDLPKWWTGFLPKDQVHLGLDLQGGIHLILEVQEDKAVEGTVEQLVLDMKEVLRKKDVYYDGIEKEGASQFRIRGVSLSDRDRFDEILSEQFGNLKLYAEDEGRRGIDYLLGITDSEVRAIKEGAVAQALETIRNRIDQYGVSEPTIQRESDNRILAQLPGVKDPERAIKLIGQTAVLEFKVVDEEHSLEAALGGTVPPGSEILYERSYDPATNRTKKIPLLIEKRTLMTGDALADARVQFDRTYNQPHVGIRFSPRGTRLFDQIAAENVNKRLAIILDGSVYSAPVIRQAHYGGQAVIEGNFTSEEARDLAIVLRAGSLPAPVEIAEKRAVGPSLGFDSIRQGMIAMAVGGALLLLFMAIYYRMPGLMAILGILFYGIVAYAIFRAVPVTLTLPGIAGFLLSTGSALDANILIFERFKEELRNGRTLNQAIQQGWQRAWPSIRDSNIATLLICAILAYFGSQSGATIVIGFAFTLAVGVLVSLFTALVVTRTLLDLVLNYFKPTNLAKWFGI